MGSWRAWHLPGHQLCTRERGAGGGAGVSLAMAFRKLKLNLGPTVPVAQVQPWVRWREGPGPASPGREDDDPGLQLPCLHQQRRHVLGPRVELQHLLSLRCKRECQRPAAAGDTAPQGRESGRSC